MLKIGFSKEKEKVVRRILMLVCRLAIVVILLGASIVSAKNENFLVINDIHLNSAVYGTKYGQDTGTQLWANTKAKLADVIKNQHPEFLLLLGDLPVHGATDAQRRTNVQLVLQQLRTTVDTADPNLPVLYVPGNNDSLGGNYHSFTDGQGETPFTLDKKASWPVLNASILDGSHLAAGYYSAYPLGASKHLLVIGLNTIIFSKRYVSDDGISQQTAAQSELDWLKTTLDKARVNHDYVYLAMHIPPGIDAYSQGTMWSHEFSVYNSIRRTQDNVQNYFLDILNANTDRIKGIFTAHTHMDEIRKIYGRTGIYRLLVIATPGITPQHLNNPGFKEFVFEQRAYNLLGSTTYYTQPSASVWGNNLYQFDTDYACQAGQNLYQCVALKYKMDLDTSMQKDFAAYNSSYTPPSPETWESIFSAIDVKY